MERRSLFGLTGGLLTLSLVGLPVLAQQPPPPASGLPGSPAIAENPTLSEPPDFAIGASPGLSIAQPELSKKMRTILALRRLLALRITVRDIEMALPILKQLRDAEKTYQKDTEQGMDEQIRTLLAAGPDDAAPASSEKLMQATMRLRDQQEQQERLWQSLGNALGKEKTAGLHALVASGVYASSAYTAPIRLSPAGRASSIRTSRGTYTLPPTPAPRGSAPGRPNPKPDAGTPLVPGAPGDDTNVRPPSALRGTSDPAVEPSLPGTPPPPSPENASPAAAPTLPGAPPTPEAAPQQDPTATVPPKPVAGQVASPASLATPVDPVAATAFPQTAPGQASASTVPGSRLRNERRFGIPGRTVSSYVVDYPGMTPHLSLSELVDLLQQKLAAMKH